MTNVANHAGMEQELKQDKKQKTQKRVVPAMVKELKLKTATSRIV